MFCYRTCPDPYPIQQRNLIHFLIKIKLSINRNPAAYPIYCDKSTLIQRYVAEHQLYPQTASCFYNKDTFYSRFLTIFLDWFSNSNYCTMRNLDIELLVAKDLWYLKANPNHGSPESPLPLLLPLLLHRSIKQAINIATNTVTIQVLMKFRDWHFWKFQDRPSSRKQKSQKVKN